jgi:4-hydroxybenzoate polyprenyltransferase
VNIVSAAKVLESGLTGKVDAGASTAGNSYARNHILLLVHYWLPMGLGWSVAIVMKNAGEGSFSPVGLILLMAGIGAAYSFDRMIDEPVQKSAPKWFRGILLATLLICTGTICILAIAGMIGTNSLRVLAVLTGASLIYSRLKCLPLAKTAVVTLAWIWACATLPFPESAHHRVLLDVTLPLTLMIAAGCILCDLKDVKEDLQEHIPSLPALFGVRSTCLTAAGLALLAAISAFLHHRFGVAVGAVLLAGAAQFPRLLAMNPTGPILVDSILIIPGVLIVMGVA